MCVCVRETELGDRGQLRESERSVGALSTISEAAVGTKRRLHSLRLTTEHHGADLLKLGLRVTRQI